MLPNGSSRHVPVVALTFAPLALACSTSSGTVHPVPDAQASHDAVASDARGDSGCHGDAATWASLTTGPLPCTENSDCCVVVNGCLSQSQIVAASSQAEAKAAWPYCDSECNLCIPPRSGFSVAPESARGTSSTSPTRATAA